MARDPEPFCPCIVTWVDAHTEATLQFSNPQEALDQHKPVIRRSIGFWIGRTVDTIAFATDDDRSPDSRQAVAGISYIPTAMCKSIEILSRPVPPKKKRPAR